MIFIFDQKGNSKATVKSGNLHQGSNLADEIIVLAPIARSSVVTMSARLPNGLYIYPALAENGKDPIALEKLDTDKALRDPAGIVYSAFRILVPAPMTQYAGILTVQFTFTMGHNPGKDENGETSFSEGQTVTTTALALTVEPGTPILAPKYDASKFADIQSYLNAALSAQVNAEASAGNAAKSEGNAAESASAAGKSAEEAKQWAIAAGNRVNLNLRNGEKRGSLVQAPSDAEKAQKEPTREHQVLLGENPPANTDDLLEVGQVFGVRQDGTVYAKGEPKDPEDLIRRCDAPPLIEPEENGGATQIYGVYAKSDSFPNGKQTAFPSSPSVIKKGWIPFRSEYGDLLVPIEPHADNAAASKEFVNSSIATATSTFRGTFDMTEADFKKLAWQTKYSDKSYYVEKNDYAFLYQNFTGGTTVYTRYKWNGTSWSKEYNLNNSGFTAAQWGAINSGITKGEISNLWSGIGEKLDLIPPPERKQMGRIYCVFAKDDIDPNGRQGYLKFSANGVEEGIVPTRNTGGNILVPETPTKPEHAASKGYVDSKMGSGSYADTAAYWKVTSGNELKITKGEWTSTSASPGLMHIGHTWAEGSDASIRAYRFGNGGGGTAGFGAKWLDLGGTETTNNNEVGALYGVKKICSTNKDVYLSFEEGGSSITSIVPSNYLMNLGSSDHKFLQVYASTITATSIVGTATRASKLTSGSVGNNSTPVYFYDGKPEQCTNPVIYAAGTLTVAASGSPSSTHTVIADTMSWSTGLIAIATYVYANGENKQVSVSEVSKSNSSTMGSPQFTIAIFNPPVNKQIKINWMLIKVN